MSEENKELAEGFMGSEDQGTVYFSQASDGTLKTYLGLAEGAIVRRDNFDLDTWENSTNWEQGIPGDAKGKITKARKYYTRDPMVYKYINFLAQLANDSFTIRAEDKGIETFYKSWFKDVEGENLKKWFFKEYFLSSNVPIFKTLIPYKPKNYEGNNPDPIESGGVTAKVMKEHQQIQEELAQAEEEMRQAEIQAITEEITPEECDKFRAAYAAKKYVWSKKMIPGAYTILNPLSIEIKGPDGLPWARHVYLKVDADVAKAIKNPDKVVKDMVAAIPKEILSQIKSGKDEVYLPPHMMTMVHADKQPYDSWAEPMCTHAFEALDYKYEMKTMDRATVRGVRNRILKVTIGNDQYPVFDNKQIKALAAEFNNPSRNLTLFWNHTLQAEYIEPNLDSLKKDKYEPVEDEIRTCFGVAKVLSGTGSESLGNSVLNLKGLVEVVKEAQEAFIIWFNQEMERIAQALSLKEVPEASFSQLNLKDENEFIRVILQMVDRQLISYETAMDTVGFYFPRELDRLEKEQKIREEKGILVPVAAPTQASADNGNDPSGQEGRPPGKTEEEPRKDREGNSRKPDGEKTVSNKKSFVDEYRDIKAGIAKMYASKVEESERACRDEKKRLTKKRKMEISTNAWYEVTKASLASYNIKESAEDLVMMSYVKANELVAGGQAQDRDEIMPSVLAASVVELKEEKE